MTTQDMNNNEAIQILSRCKHEITQLRETINYLKPKADAYDNISTILQLFSPQTGMLSGDDLLWIIQKRIDELSATTWTSKPEVNPVQTPTPTQELNKFDPDPYSPKTPKENFNRIAAEIDAQNTPE